MNKLEKLRNTFYFKDNKPCIDSYGIFNSGLTAEECKNYLRVRANKWDIRKELKKIENLSRGSTCPFVQLDGKGYNLIYRHDWEHYCDVVLNNKPFIFD